MEQIGCVGYLKGSFIGDEKEPWVHWQDHHRYLKTKEFTTELDKVVNSLRENGLLKDLDSMAEFIRAHGGAAIDEYFCTEYGFLADTEKYSYLIRL